MLIFTVIFKCIFVKDFFYIFQPKQKLQSTCIYQYPKIFIGTPDFFNCNEIFEKNLNLHQIQSFITEIDTEMVKWTFISPCTKYTHEIFFILKNIFNLCVLL